MKISALLVLLFTPFIGCQNPQPKPQSPNINWTTLDEPPLYPDCPMENPEDNLNCFTKTLQERLDNKFKMSALSNIKMMDTLFVTLKVDTVGQLSILGYKHSNKERVLPKVYSSVEDVITSLPRFQPAFKTNLEIPVEVQWTLPLTISQ